MRESLRVPGELVPERGEKEWGEGSGERGEGWTAELSQEHSGNLPFMPVPATYDERQTVAIT